jgi:hypothetical protein
METLAVIGALAATEGCNSMAVMATAQEPTGKMSWTAREVASADQAFAAANPTLVGTWVMTSACVLAWKEAAFPAKSRDDEMNPT